MPCTVLMCPICQSALSLEQHNSATWRCSQGHSYDVAKQGYVNLHVVQHKHSKNPGDTVDSVQARRRFLSAGHYQALQQQIVQVLSDLDIGIVVDIGCGEGYYSQALAQTAEQVIAVDIAKNAVQIAAKQDREGQVTWVVGTGAVLPVLSHTVDVCCSFFSPLPKAEMLRLLKDEGYVLFATPNTGHLFSMRQALFEQVNPHQPEKFLTQLQPELSLVKEWDVVQDLRLNRQDLNDLIAMTPYAYKAKLEHREQLQQQDHFHTQAQFKLYLMQKVSP
ncbi:putative RNA methyltransferase [Acinetobacter sp. c2-A9]|uniref:putative RNA methyltransferase n=1 Tax=Acinetobacter sp. c2-A9 TaxID=3342802 RepID=UPI0035B9D64E